MYLGIFDNAGDVLDHFDAPDDALDGATMLIAYYDYEDWTGAAYVLFERWGALYEVHGSHCSCYGLEGQWEPEDTTLESLRHRLTAGHLGRSYGMSAFADELTAILNQREATA